MSTLSASTGFLNFDFAQWTEYDDSDEPTERQRLKKRHHKSENHLYEKSDRTSSPFFYYNPTSGSSKIASHLKISKDDSLHKFVLNKFKRSNSGEFHLPKFRSRSGTNPTSQPSTGQKSPVNTNQTEEEEVGGEILIDLEMLPLTGRLNVNLIKVRNVSAPGMTCTPDDWYYAKVTLVCSSPKCRDSISKKRTQKCHAALKTAEPSAGSESLQQSSSHHYQPRFTKHRADSRTNRRLTTGDVLMTTGGEWLEVNFSEQFNFALRGSSHHVTNQETSNSPLPEPQAAHKPYLDCKLTISVYCQKGKRSHELDPSKVHSSPDCGLVHSILPLMRKQLIGSCTIGTSVSGLGGEHWAEADRAAEVAQTESYSGKHKQNVNVTTITKWHPLMLNKQQQQQVNVSHDNNKDQQHQSSK